MAWATVALFILTFSPVPFSFVPPSPAQQQQQEQPDPQSPGINVMERMPIGHPNVGRPDLILRRRLTVHA
jgi:hypothetical protein